MGGSSHGIPCPRMSVAPIEVSPAERTVGQLVADAIRLYGRHFWRGLLIAVPATAFTVGAAFVDGAIGLAYGVVVGSLALGLSHLWASVVATGGRNAPGRALARRRGRVPPARGLARGRLRGDLLRRARLVRALRARGAERARRGPEPGRGASAQHRARPSRLRARLRDRGRAGDRRHRVDLLALAGDRRIRVAGHRRRSGARGPRAVAALLPGLGPSVSRPEGAVRVRLTTTKEARCPSTSCCRA